MLQDVTLVGCGGIGGWLIGPLCAELAARKFTGTLTLIDGDSVEAKNVGRQNFVPDDVGMQKVHVMEGIARQYLGKEASVVCHDDYLSGENIAELVGFRRLILAGPDNHPVRRLLLNWAETALQTNLVVGGNEMADGLVLVRSCMFSDTIEKRHPEIWAADPKTDKAQMSCAELAALPSGGQTMMANVMCAHLMLGAAIALMDKWDKASPVEIPQEIYFNVWPPAIRTVKP